MIAAFIGFCFGALLMLLSIKRNPFRKGQVMTIHFLDGTWFKGLRKSSYIGNETYGTHHFQVLEDESDSESSLKNLVGERLAVPINSVKYYIIHDKK